MLKTKKIAMIMYLKAINTTIYVIQENSNIIKALIETFMGCIHSLFMTTL